MSDATRNSTIYTENGGVRTVVQSGGEIKFEAGSSHLPAHSIKVANFTLDGSESDTIFLCDAADIVVTLPATVAGLRYTFILGKNGLSAGTGLSISPVAADAIHGNGLTNVDNKDLINSGATDRIGDSVTIVGDGVDGWFIQSVIGTWAKEA